MKRRNEVRLSNGALVRVEPVPPLAYTSIVAEMPECQIPPPPMEEIKGKTGISRLPARQGTPEYDLWQQEVDRARRAGERIRIEAYYTLGVVSWKLRGQKSFSDVIPDDWEIPARLIQAGLKPHVGIDGRRWDFILYGLITTPADMQALSNVLLGKGPLMEAEVEAASNQFPSDTEQPATS